LFFLLNSPAAVAAQVRGRVAALGLASFIRLRRALSPTFPAGEMAFFIPWRVVAEESGAAHLDLLGPPGRAGVLYIHRIAGSTRCRLTIIIAGFRMRVPRRPALPDYRGAPKGPRPACGTYPNPLAYLTA